jgi:phosphodiesterase/alkaline phosphatase D-like protein
MNKNLAIGVLAAVVILGGGWYLWYANQPQGQNGAATSTASSASETSSAPNAASSATAPSPSAPTAVTDQNAVPSNSTAVVTGRVTPNGAPTTYWYEYGATSALGQKTAAQSIGSSFDAVPSPGYITGLHANTTYYFRLSAQNAYGTGSGATYSFSTNTNPPPPGAAPTTITNAATGISRTTANLNGHVNPNSADTNYWFEYGVSSALGQATGFQSAGNGNTSSAVSASLSNLNPLTKYYFRLNAQNQFGTVNGAIQSFSTPGPAAPGVPTVDTTSATKIATSSATLNGRINPNGAQTSYWFEYSEDSLLGSILGTVTPAQSVQSGTAGVNVSGDATNLQSNTKYYYRLVGRNDYGTVRGSIMSFKTRP